MCGIFGFATKTVPTDAQWGYQAIGLMVDTVRGRDSTGLAAISTKGDFLIGKRALAGPDFIHSDVFMKMEKSFKQFNYFIGHNRAATHGTVKDYNAHPFHVKGTKNDIILVHNGTIQGWRNNEISPRSFEHDVDSAHIASGFAEYGERETMERLDGWFVLVWANLTLRTFNIARSDCRDISLGFSKDHKDLYFGSEDGMVSWVAEHQDLSIPDGFLAPGPYEWISWSLDDKSFKDWKIEKFKKFEKVYYSQKNARRFVPGAGQTLLADMGYTAGKKNSIAFGVDKWAPFATTNPHNGVLWGTTAHGDPWGGAEPRLVKVYSVSKEDYETVINDEFHRNYILGTPQRVDTYEGKEAIVVDLDMAELKRALALSNIRVQGMVPAEATDIGVAMREALAKGKESFIKGQTCEIPVKSEPAKVVGPNGDLISVDQWREKTEDGCCLCSGPIKNEDHAKLKWIGEYGHDPLCHDCSDRYVNNRSSLPVVISNTAKAS